MLPTFGLLVLLLFEQRATSLKLCSIVSLPQELPVPWASRWMRKDCITSPLSPLALLEVTVLSTVLRRMWYGEVFLVSQRLSCSLELNPVTKK